MCRLSTLVAYVLSNSPLLNVGKKKKMNDTFVIQLDITTMDVAHYLRSNVGARTTYGYKEHAVKEHGWLCAWNMPFE